LSSPATHDRFIGFLIEHHDGNFPLWLAPDAARLRKGIVAELRSLRDLVKDAIREALRLDETWNLRFQFLLRKDHPAEDRIGKSGLRGRE